MPIKFSEKQIRKILAEHRKGKSIAQLSCIYRVSTSTLYRWKKKLSGSKHEYVQGTLVIMIC